MCTAWIIDGKRVESGQELLDAIGIERAKYVNTSYDDIGMTMWMSGPNGERIEFPWTDSRVEDGCLCHVDEDRMTETFGRVWRYDPELDAMTHSEPS